jgi:ligand-binding sensor domain-containing protein
VLTDFGVVDAVAADETIVYVVTRGGIGVYDPRFRRWLPPVTRVDGFDPQRTWAALVDPTDRSLWLATELGLINYTPQLHRFESVWDVGRATQLMFDRADAFAGIYVRVGSDWRFLPRGGTIAQPARSLPPADRQVRPSTVEEVLRRFPYLSTMRAGILTDQRMRTYAYTAAATVPGTDEVFIGTDGLGLLRFDAATSESESLRFGLLGSGAGGLAVVPGGVWVGSGGLGGRSGLTFVGSDLQRFEFVEGAGNLGPAGIVRTVCYHAGKLWAASETGVLLTDGGREVRRVARNAGLPGDRVYSLAAAEGGVWAGTDRGLAFITDAGPVDRVGGYAGTVVALAARGDTVWVGTQSGIGLLVPSEDRIVVPTGVAQVAELGQPIVALAFSDDTLVVATRDGVVWRGAGSGERGGGWTVERPISGRLGTLTALVGDAGGIWVGGERGIASYRFSTRQFIFFDTPGDLPGVVRDLAVDEQYLWVATDGGLVRFERGAVSSEPGAESRERGAGSRELGAESPVTAPCSPLPAPRCR